MMQEMTLYAESKRKALDILSRSEMSGDMAFIMSEDVSRETHLVSCNEC